MTQHTTQDSQSEIKEAMSELFKLCKEVYEKTGWWNVSISHMWSGKETTDFKTPLYTSDYLLEKLPVSITHNKYGTHFTQYQFNFAMYEDFCEVGYKLSLGRELCVVSADTPLKALLKLTLALHEAGELS